MTQGHVPQRETVRAERAAGAHARDLRGRAVARAPIGWVVAVGAVMCAPAGALLHAQAVASTASAPAPTPQSAQQSAPRPVARPALAAAPRRDVLYPGDIVRLRIWREPDLSGDFDVSAQGVAVFPKIGAVQVTVMSTDSLQRLLINTYSQFLRDPAIEVTPLRRITVLGAVKNPGLYPTDPTMSVADALALAGGPTPDGNQKKLQLIRAGKKQNVTITVHQQVAETPIRSGDELYVPERSWLSRNGYIVGAIIGAATIVTTTIVTHR